MITPEVKKMKMAPLNDDLGALMGANNQKRRMMRRLEERPRRRSGEDGRHRAWRRKPGARGVAGYLWRPWRACQVGSDGGRCEADLGEGGGAMVGWQWAS